MIHLDAQHNTIRVILSRVLAGSDFIPIYYDLFADNSRYRDALQKRISFCNFAELLHS